MDDSEEDFPAFGLDTMFKHVHICQRQQTRLISRTARPGLKIVR